MSMADETMAAVAEAFRFLTEEYDFERTEVHAGQREGHVRFVSPTTRVTVYLDYMPLQVSTAVALFREGTRRRLVHEFGLPLVVRDRNPEDADHLCGAVVLAGKAAAAQADALRRYAADLLRGERQRLPRLRRAQAAEIRRQNKEEFGTSTGETPRFQGRPSLEELFADADSDGLITPRTYQAFWDYDYTLAEIAAFLGETSQGIQARLDDWDML